MIRESDLRAEGEKQSLLPSLADSALSETCAKAGVGWLTRESQGALQRKDSL